MTKHQGNWHILVNHLQSPGEGFSLGSGLWIKPIKVDLNVFNLAGLGAIGFREWAVLEPIISTCRSEIVSAKDADIKPGYDALNRAWLALALLCLKGYTAQMGVAGSAFSWEESEVIRKKTSRDYLEKEIAGVSKPDEEKSKPRFNGGLLDYHLKFIITKQPKIVLEKQDAEWVAEHFEKFNWMASNSETFRFSLEAAVDWRFSTDIRAAISRIWAGIESILQLKSETVFRLSTIAASLLAERGDERLAKFKAIKKLYEARSKAVHGGTFKAEALEDALYDSFELLSGLLLLCVEKGKVLGSDDFDQAMFF